MAQAPENLLLGNGIKDRVERIEKGKLTYALCKLPRGTKTLSLLGERQAKGDKAAQIRACQEDCKKSGEYILFLLPPFLSVVLRGGYVWPAAHILCKLLLFPPFEELVCNITQPMCQRKNATVHTPHTRRPQKRRLVEIMCVSYFEPFVAHSGVSHALQRAHNKTNRKGNRIWNNQSRPLPHASIYLYPGRCQRRW